MRCRNNNKPAIIKQSIDSILIQESVARGLYEEFIDEWIDLNNRLTPESLEKRKWSLGAFGKDNSDNAAIAIMSLPRA